jgi:hypothetical protein
VIRRTQSLSASDCSYSAGCNFIDFTVSSNELKLAVGEGPALPQYDLP